MTDSGAAVESQRRIMLAVLVAALGYFVDIYDLILFTIVRVPSLKALQVPESRLMDTGVALLNWQNTGMVVGGIVWGVLGDRRGRLSVLFGSILLYSFCNIANGFIDNTTEYAALRFLAGVGLAGELGAGVTLVSELMHRLQRGWGSTLIAGVGTLGGVTAGLIGDRTSWRTAYFIGGGLGLLLFLLRVGVRESTLFMRTKGVDVPRGRLWMLVSSPARARRYLALIALAMPVWLVFGILITFSPEIARARHMPELPSVGRAVFFAYMGLMFGNLLSGALSQRWKSRKRALNLYLGLVVVTTIGFFLSLTTLGWFYLACTAVGFTSGYWGLFVLVVSEQFGTNVRATATTTAPNFVRGAIVPMNWGFQLFKRFLTVPQAAGAVGAIVIGLALLSLYGMEETYGKDLDFIET